jgi:hypothetical protein
MVGTWTGSGFNTIFRPLNPNSPNQLPIPVGGDNILELNLTSETTTFTAIQGAIPNRGFEQVDIALAGMIYLQQISDVTTLPATGIHVEPGIWVVIPSTTDPADGPTVTRMASIPHGTTINAQGTTTIINGPPNIPVISITPTVIGGHLFEFASQTATNQGTARIPQDLTPFIAEGRITQDMITNPNSVLTAAIHGQNIIATTQISISTQIVPPIIAGGGTDNIEFLIGAPPLPGTPPTQNPTPNANANSATMTATFWIETVEHTVLIGPIKPGDPPVPVPLGPPNQPRRIMVKPLVGVSRPTPLTLRFTQIQYSQIVNLNFNGLIWPHVSVATLVSTAPISTPPGWGA